MTTLTTKTVCKTSIQKQQAALDLEYSRGCLSKFICQLLWATGLRKKLDKKRRAQITRLKQIENEKIYESNLTIYSQAATRFRSAASA